MDTKKEKENEIQMTTTVSKKGLLLLALTVYCWSGPNCLQLSKIFEAYGNFDQFLNTLLFIRGSTLPELLRKVRVSTTSFDIGTNLFSSILGELGP